MRQQQELLRGTVNAVVFYNAENGYCVLRLQCEDGELTNVVGMIPMPVVGERLLITGHWVSHNTYGRQFEAEFLERLMPETRREIEAYLASGALKGVGVKTAHRIVQLFGERALEVLEKEPEQLTQITGITAKKAAQLSSAFQKQSGIRRLVEYLCVNGLPAELAVRTYRLFGPESLEVLQEDPYVLTQPEIGAGFAAVDAFALRCGVAPDDTRRIEAGTIFELTYNLRGGHVFLPLDKLCAATAAMLQQPAESVQEAVACLLEGGQLVLRQIAGLQAVYLPEYYDAETAICQRIRSMAKRKPDQCPGKGLLQRVQQEAGMVYGAEQRAAIEAAAEHQLLLLTGGPGTGKTTTLTAILHLFEHMGLATQLAAPTGRAAKRLSEVTGHEAVTIHRLLEAGIDPETGCMAFVRNGGNPLKLGALIVDEMSMVDLLLMQSLLEALPLACRLVLVGDPDQLPSVGAGNVFSDLLRSGVVCTARLTEIYRQARQSLIVMNAHAVNEGRLPELGAKDRDFFFLRRLDSERLVKTVQDLCVRRLPQNLGIDPKNIQVLSPTRKGPTGTYELNCQLQAVLNPPQETKKEKKYGAFCFREGDRVMQIRNNYDILWTKEGEAQVGAGIFNGDIGTIQEISFRDECMRIAFDDRLAEYSFTLLQDLELAYAMTVHKSQGSEYQAVILSVLQGSKYLLSRNVLYTALTRARQLLILIGSEEVVAQMTANNVQQRRYSGLKLRLQKEE